MQWPPLPRAYYDSLAAIHREVVVEEMLVNNQRRGVLKRKKGLGGIDVAAAVVMQSCWRCYALRKQYVRARSAVTTIRAWWIAAKQRHASELIIEKKLGTTMTEIVLTWDVMNLCWRTRAELYRVLTEDSTSDAKPSNGTVPRQSVPRSRKSACLKALLRLVTAHEVLAASLTGNASGMVLAKCDAAKISMVGDAANVASSRLKLYQALSSRPAAEQNKWFDQFGIDRKSKGRKGALVSLMWSAERSHLWAFSAALTVAMAL